MVVVIAYSCDGTLEIAAGQVETFSHHGQAIMIETEHGKVIL